MMIFPKYDLKILFIYYYFTGFFQLTFNLLKNAVNSFEIKLIIIKKMFLRMIFYTFWTKWSLAFFVQAKISHSIARVLQTLKLLILYSS
jgi:hypothetical protein